MRTSSLALLFACVLTVSSVAEAATVTKSDKLAGVNGKEDCMSQPIEGPFDSLAVSNYLKNCLVRGSAHNVAVLSKYVVSFIVRDKKHDTIAGFATLDEAKAEKSDNDDAVVLSARDPDFVAMRQALWYREEHSTDPLPTEAAN